MSDNNRKAGYYENNNKSNPNETIKMQCPICTHVSEGPRFIQKKNNYSCPACGLGVLREIKDEKAKPTEIKNLEKEAKQRFLSWAEHNPEVRAVMENDGTAAGVIAVEERCRLLFKCFYGGYQQTAEEILQLKKQARSLKETVHNLRWQMADM